MKVSIIIPVYNVEEYLEECLNSAINQTLKDIEIIAINDGSTDNSLDILKKYEDKYDNFILINKENEGQSVARNTGLKIAKGEYIYFLDSDDYILNNDVIEYCYGTANNNFLDIITFDSIDIYKKGNNIYRPLNDRSSRKDRLESIIKSGEEFFNECLEKEAYKYTIWLNLYKRDFLIKNNLKFQVGRIYEDIPFNVFAFIKAERILYVPYDFYYRRLREGSITSCIINEKYVLSEIKNGDEIKDFYIDNKKILKEKTRTNLMKYFIKSSYTQQLIIVLT